jgi:hypothetical protein
MRAGVERPVVSHDKGGLRGATACLVCTGTSCGSGSNGDFRPAMTGDRADPGPRSCRLPPSEAHKEQADLQAWRNCRAPKAPAGDMADYEPVTATLGNLIGVCSDCEAMMYRRVSLARLGQVRGKLDITRPQAPSGPQGRAAARRAAQERNPVNAAAHRARTSSAAGAPEGR